MSSNRWVGGIRPADLCPCYGQNVSPKSHGERAICAAWDFGDSGAVRSSIHERSARSRS